MPVGSAAPDDVLRSSSLSSNRIGFLVSVVLGSLVVPALFIVGPVVFVAIALVANFKVGPVVLVSFVLAADFKAGPTTTNFLCRAFPVAFERRRFGVSGIGKFLKYFLQEILEILEIILEI